LAVITTVIDYFPMSPVSCYHNSNRLLSDISCWLLSLK